MERPADTETLTGRIGIFNDSFPPIMDGVTLTVENYVHWLRERGHDTCVVTPWNPESRSYPYEVMRFFSLPIFNRRPYRYGYPKLDPFIWRKLRRTPFRLVHAHSPFATGRLGVYVKRKQGVPLIGTFHSKYRSDLEHSFHRTPWMVPIIMGRILDFFNSCDEVWIPQAQVEETVREYGYRGPLTVVENGNDYAGMPDDRLADYRESARREVGIPRDTIGLLFVGQHIFEKGTDVIVRALGLLKGRVRFHMDFIGNGYAVEELQRMCAEEGISDSVTFHGVIHDRELLRRHYAAADLFLFPSLYDNAPLVLREAAAMGTPAVLVSGATAAEVITDGRNGFLTRRTPEAYARVIESLSADRSKLRYVATGARQTLVRSWQDVVGEVEDRYRSLIRRSCK